MGIVITRLRNDPRTKAYMARPLAAGRSKPEVIRVLKRYLAREIYHHLPRPRTTPILAAGLAR